VSEALVVERLVPASVEDVFAAWTTPERMAEWLSPVGHAEAEADLRVGGTFRVVMADERSRIEHSGEYLELHPPSRLVFTWVSQYTGPEPSVVTVELHPHEEGTRLVLTHDRLPAEVLESHRGGWAAMLDRLAEILGGKEGTP
jgi:uncharacterized protein YndB with AHSA1/START domain